jgi:hypothetical protein
MANKIMNIKPLVRLVVGLELVLLGLLSASILGQTAIYLGGIIMITGIYHWNNERAPKNSAKKKTNTKKARKRR